MQEPNNTQRVIRLDPKTQRKVDMLSKFAKNNTFLSDFLEGVKSGSPVDAKYFLGMGKVLASDLRKPKFLIENTKTEHLTDALVDLILFVSQQTNGIENVSNKDYLIATLNKPVGDTDSINSVNRFMEKLGPDLTIPEDFKALVADYRGIQMFNDLGRGLHIQGVKCDASIDSLKKDQIETIICDVIKFCDNDHTLLRYIMLNVHQGLYAELGKGMTDYARVDGQKAIISSKVMNPSIHLFRQGGRLQVEVSCGYGMCKAVNGDDLFYVDDKNTLQSTVNFEHAIMRANKDNPLINTRALLQLDLIKEPKPAEGAEKYTTMGVKQKPLFLEYSSKISGVVTSRPGIDYSLTEVEAHQAKQQMSVKK